MNTKTKTEKDSPRATSATSAVTPVFQVGETVYSAIAPDERGMVTGIMQRFSSCVYLVTWACNFTTESEHAAQELSREPLYHQATR